jgi:hypothetical protein
MYFIFQMVGFCRHASDWTGELMGEYAADEVRYLW